MVETRRMSRRLQAKAAAAASSPTPTVCSGCSPTVKRLRRTPSPKKKLQYQSKGDSVEKHKQVRKRIKKEVVKEKCEVVEEELKGQCEVVEEGLKEQCVVEEGLKEQCVVVEEGLKEKCEVVEDTEIKEMEKVMDQVEGKPMDQKENQLEGHGEDVETITVVEPTESSVVVEEDNEKSSAVEGNNKEIEKPTTDLPVEDVEKLVELNSNETVKDTSNEDVVVTEMEEEEEILLLDSHENKSEENSDDEDIDQYAFLAASGLNFSKKCSQSSTALKVPPAPTPSLPMKPKLVPNLLDSGASHYKEYFTFDGSKSSAITMHADTRIREEAKVLAASRKATAHSERQRSESQQKQLAGRRWFNFESNEMTDDARRDFALLRMRNYLDPKKFYKTSDHTRALPKHFQTGVVIEGAHEFHSARLTKKQRRKTFTDEVMADEAIMNYTHRVASNIQKTRSTNKKRRRW